MGGIVWALLQRRWLYVAGFVLLTVGIFLGRPASGVVMLVGAAMLVGSIALRLVGAFRGRPRADVSDRR